jgi:hypothetical protein
VGIDAMISPEEPIEPDRGHPSPPSIKIGTESEMEAEEEADLSRIAETEDLPHRAARNRLACATRSPDWSRRRTARLKKV